MDIRFDYNLKKRVGRAGSVLVMVVVLTVLLALIGVLFVVMARMDNMSASGASNNVDLHAGVEAVVDKIKSLMVEDLFTAAPFQPDERVEIDKMYDSPSARDIFGRYTDPWLASLEPARFSDGGTPNDETDDIYIWPYISDVYGTVGGRTRVRIRVEPAAGSREADADGDGVIDSRWILIPKMKSTKGKDIYAAVRIIDNCAMLNLNTAHSKDSSTETSYLAEAGYLSAVDYERFLRGDDRDPLSLDNIRKARNRGLVDTAEDHHDNVVMNIENPGVNYSLFDIGDELEIRNRYMLTSLAISRFERKGNSTVTPVILPVAYETFDGSRGYEVGGPGYDSSIPPPLKVKRIPYDDITKWMKKINSDYFDASLGDITKNWSYDRRHVCTFYSFDRNLRRRDYPLVDVVGDITSPPPAAPTPWTIGVSPLNIKDYSLLTPIITPAITPAEILSTFDQDVFIPAYGAAGINDITSNTLQSRKNILHLLYALRAYFIDNDSVGATDKDIVTDAATRSAQYIANMIDYADDVSAAQDGPFGAPNYGNQKNDNITYIDRSIIRQLIFDISKDVLGPVNAINIDIQSEYDFGFGIDDPAEIVYGYERQPFISELTSKISSGEITELSIELCNPYKIPNGNISLDGWQIMVGTDPYDLTGRSVSAASAAGLGYFVINETDYSGMLTSIKALNATVKLQRPDPTDPTGTTYITVDETEAPQTAYLLSVADNSYVSKRDDTNWRFVDSSWYTNSTPSPGTANGYQLPVANNSDVLRTLRGLEGVTFLGNGGPNGTITQQIATVAGEEDIRFDVANDLLLEYISLINRPEGRLPGRINVNTATMEVIRAAIPEKTPLAWAINADALATSIVSSRPFTSIGDLLNVAGFKDFVTGAKITVDDVGDAELTDDFEERDWILSRLANIFTVRSDTFTAYILVRLGTDGPQKRMIAILDRTGVFSPSDRPKLVALHPVPDPR